jgi:hypothetical protein
MFPRKLHRQKVVSSNLSIRGAVFHRNANSTRPLHVKMIESIQRDRMTELFIGTPRIYVLYSLTPGWFVLSWDGAVADLGRNLQNHDLRVIRSPLAGSPLSRRTQQFTMHNLRGELFSGITGESGSDGSGGVTGKSGSDGSDCILSGPRWFKSDFPVAGLVGSWQIVMATGWQFPRKVGIGELVWSQSPFQGLSVSLVGVRGLRASGAA